MLDFAALPPEINSTRIYAGPGAGPLLAAATAWGLLAGELDCAATRYSSTIANLAAAWRGPAALSMGRSAAPVLAWLAATAVAAEQTAVQATAAAGAYELARAMTVPPPLIAANRALLMALVATNLLGQNTPAIAATEAHYAQMWIQDAVAMFTYAGSSAAANRLTAFTAPTTSSNSAGLAAQSAAVAHAIGTAVGSQPTTLHALMASTPAALQQLAAPTVTTTAPTVVDLLEHIPNLVNTTLSTSNAVTSARGIDITNHRLAFQQARIPTPLLVAAPAVTAAMGRAETVGGLAVPANWATPPPAVRPMALTLPAATPAAMPAATATAAGMGSGSMFAPAALATMESRDRDQRKNKSTPVLVRPAAAR